MTTTPTFWSQVVTFDQNSFQSFVEPKVTALADDSFAIVWEDGTDIFGKHFDEMGQLTTGNFLQALSTNTSKPIFDPVILQQADGRVVVEYGLVFSQTTMPISIDRDVQWHSAAFDNSTSNTSPSRIPPLTRSFSTPLRDQMVSAASDRRSSICSMISMVARTSRFALSDSVGNPGEQSDLRWRARGSGAAESGVGRASYRSCHRRV